MIYPVERIKYCKTVGRTRVENIAEILRSFDGFDVIVKEPEAHDVDVWVFKQTNLVLVIEVINWKQSAYMDFKRTIAIRENLTDPSYNGLNKLLVFSFWENIRNQMDFLDNLNIDFVEIGFQTQPIPYYNFFLDQGLTDNMRLNDHTTKEVLRRKLETYLTKKELI